jgi:hypothetical protein
MPATWRLLLPCSKREYKIKNLEAECAKIAAKEKTEGGLTQGQASTLVRTQGSFIIVNLFNSVVTSCWQL